MTTPVVPRARATWDVVLSIVLLVGNAAVFFGGGFLAFFVLAFTDNCPAGCDIDAAVTAVYSVAIALALLGLAGTVGTIVLLVVRRRAWWLPLAVGILTVVGWVVAFALYGAAVSPQ